MCEDRTEERSERQDDKEDSVKSSEDEPGLISDDGSITELLKTAREELGSVVKKKKGTPLTGN